MWARTTETTPRFGAWYNDPGAGRGKLAPYIPTKWNEIDMSASERANRDKNMAAYLKKNNITRDTGKCPWGCGAPLRNGGQALSTHLNVCHGSPRRGPRISPRNLAKMPFPGRIQGRTATR